MTWTPPHVPFGPAAGPTWQCRTCRHRIYEHSTRKEPNSGIRYYAACNVAGCSCLLGQNHRYPAGQIDT